MSSIRDNGWSGSSHGVILVGPLHWAPGPRPTFALLNSVQPEIDVDHTRCDPTPRVGHHRLSGRKGPARRSRGVRRGLPPVRGPARRSRSWRMWVTSSTGLWGWRTGSTCGPTRPPGPGRRKWPDSTPGSRSSTDAWPPGTWWTSIPRRSSRVPSPMRSPTWASSRCCGDWVIRRSRERAIIERRSPPGALGPDQEPPPLRVRMSPVPLSRSVEDYLKAIYGLSKGGDAATTSAIALGARDPARIRDRHDQAALRGQARRARALSRGPTDRRGTPRGAQDPAQTPDPRGPIWRRGSATRGRMSTTKRSVWSTPPPTD